jgi:hypothetical protein
MLDARIVMFLLATMLLAASNAAAQQMQVPVSIANICSTQWGWCPLNPNIRVSVGFACQCVAYSGQVLPGVGRQFPYENYGRPVSPYLNPHWMDAPPGPVIK